MKIKNKVKTDFSEKPQYENYLNFTDKNRNTEVTESEHFVVPWQLSSKMRKEVIER